MTSKISFRKIISEVIGQRLWLIILISAVAALAYPIVLQTLLHEGAAMDESKEQLYYVVTKILGNTAGQTYFFLCIAAVISSASCFFYMNSKEKTDFYHSVAVKRQKIFLSRWIAGIVIVVIPYIAAMLVSIFVILPINGLLTGEMAGELVGSMFFFVFAYSAVYAVCVLAMTFSGRILTGLFLMAVFLGYVPCVYYVLRGLFANFYPSLDIPSFSFLNLGWGFYTSPLSSAGGIAFGAGNTIACWIITAAFLVGGFLAGMYIHKVRASETAGQSMTFPVLKSVIKVLVGVMAALIAGYIGISFHGENGIVLFIVWALVAAFIVNIFVEYLYGTDFKTIFKKWISAIILFGIVVASIIIIAGDPAGINKWKPEINEVNRMSFHTDFQLGEFGDFYCNEVVDKKIRLEEGLIQDFKPIYEVVDPELKSDDALITTYFEYELKNGKKVRRNYSVPEDRLINMVYKLSDSGEFREKYYPTWTADLESFSKAEVYAERLGSMAGGDKNYTIPKNRLPELVKAIREDSIQVGIKDLSKSKAVNYINFSDNARMMKVEYGTLYSSSYYGGEQYCEVEIYPQYEKTISFLREVTGDTSIGKETDFALRAKDIKELKLYTYDDEIYITEKKDIAEILDSIKEAKSEFLEEIEQGIEIEIHYSDDTFEGCGFNILDKEKYNDVIKKYEFKLVAE